MSDLPTPNTKAVQMESYKKFAEEKKRVRLAKIVAKKRLQSQQEEREDRIAQEVNTDESPALPIRGAVGISHLPKLYFQPALEVDTNHSSLPSPAFLITPDPRVHRKKAAMPLPLPIGAEDEQQPTKEEEAQSDVSIVVGGSASEKEAEEGEDNDATQATDSDNQEHLLLSTRSIHSSDSTIGAATAAQKDTEVDSKVDARVHEQRLRRNEQYLFKLCSVRHAINNTRLSKTAFGVNREGNVAVCLTHPDLNKIRRLLQEPRLQEMDLLSTHADHDLDMKRTCLHAAAISGFLECGKLLIDHWLENSSRNTLLGLQEVHTAMCAALTAGVAIDKDPVVQSWLRFVGLPARNSLELLDLDGDGRVEWEELVSITGNNILVNARDAEGNTPLHDAAEGGYLSFCALLLAHGANVDAQNDAGETPLHCAISSRHEEVCRLLVEKGANVMLSNFMQLPLQLQHRVNIQLGRPVDQAVQGTLVEGMESDPFYRYHVMGDLGDKTAIFGGDSESDAASISAVEKDADWYRRSRVCRVFTKNEGLFSLGTLDNVVGEGEQKVLGLGKLLCGAVGDCLTTWVDACSRAQGGKVRVNTKVHQEPSFLQGPPLAPPVHFSPDSDLDAFAHSDMQFDLESGDSITSPASATHRYFQNCEQAQEQQPPYHTHALARFVSPEHRSQFATRFSHLHTTSLPLSLPHRHNPTVSKHSDTASTASIGTTSSSSSSRSYQRHWTREPHQQSLATCVPLCQLEQQLQDPVVFWESPMSTTTNPKTSHQHLSEQASVGSSPQQSPLLVFDRSDVDVDLTAWRAGVSRGMCLHLLIEHMPSVAALAVDGFRRPVGRCTAVNNVRWFEQTWDPQQYACMQQGSSSHDVMMLGSASTGLLFKKSQKHLKTNTSTKAGALKTGLGCLWFLLAFIARIICWVPLMMWRFISGSVRDNRKLAGEILGDCVRDPKGIMYMYDFSAIECEDGMSPLLDKIIECECKELLRHKWVEQLLDHKWSRFGRQGFQNSFWLYFAFFVSFVLDTVLQYGDDWLPVSIFGEAKYGRFKAPTGQAQIFGLNALNPKQAFEQSPWELVRRLLGFTTFLINVYYTVREFRSVGESGGWKRYRSDGWNWCSLTQICCVWAFNFCRLFGPFHISGGWTWEQTLQSVCAPLFFLRFLHFARTNRVFGPYVRVIIRMFRDIATFSIVFVLFLLGFAHSLYIQRVAGHTSVYEAAMSVFQLGLGDWDYDSIASGGTVAKVVFILYSWVGTIMLLNMLIAIMSTTYEKVTESTYEYWQLERAAVILKIQEQLDDEEYRHRHYTPFLYSLEGDEPIVGIRTLKFKESHDGGYADKNNGFWSFVGS